jgi:hypothetical protein
MLHAQALRDTLRLNGINRPSELTMAFAQATADTVEPWFQSTSVFDRHRLGEMKAAADGSVYRTDDPTYEVFNALSSASMKDPEVFRAFLDVVGVLDLPETVLSRPEMFEKVVELGADWRSDPSLGPDRAELVALANG